MRHGSTPELDPCALPPGLKADERLRMQRGQLWRARAEQILANTGVCETPGNSGAPNWASPLHPEALENPFSPQA
eukprot:8714550-Alexandrium_andersonii.AAC.1